jgi:ribosomal protein L37AE/L43A
MTEKPKKRHECVTCGAISYRVQSGPRDCWSCYWKARPEAYEVKREYQRTRYRTMAEFIREWAK